jgi:hypothetical protein
MGLPLPGATSVEAFATTLPAELRELLCTQSWTVVDAVTRAWNAAETLPTGALAEFRGGALTLKRVEGFLRQRQEAAMAVVEEAIEEARVTDALREQGRDMVQTIDGPVMIDVAAFEKACPVPMQWAFVKDVMVEISMRDLRLLTKANLSSRIAEAAYARIALPFAKDKPWEDSVRVLGKQMATRWDKPRRIWDSWYAVADLAVIHKAGAFCHT